jgi:integral membrane sensor domain MASE1
VRSTLAAIGQVFALAAAYFLAAKLGLLLSILHGNVTAFWPASGIAVAAAVIVGRRALLGVWVGQFAVTFTAFRAGHDDVSLAAALIMSACMGLAGLAEAAVGAWSVRHFSAEHPLSSRRALFWFILWACIVGGVVAATIGTATLGVGGACPWDKIVSTWLTWWLGDTMGVLIVGPPLLVWFVRTPTPPYGVFRRRRWYLEFIAAEMVLLATALLAFDLLPWQMAPHAPLTFLIAPGLIWLTVRFDLHGATAAVATLALLAVTATVFGRGPFVADDLAGSLLVLQAFIATLTVTFLTLAVSSAQQRRAEAALSHELEHRVHARTVELAVVNEELRTEVAERRRTEQQLRQQEQLFRQVLEALPVGVVIADPSGLIVRDNPAMARIWGRTRGLTLADFQRINAPLADTGAAIEAEEWPLARAIHERRVCIGQRICVTSVDQSTRAIHMSAAPIFDEAGEFLGGVAVGEDITARVG